MGPEALAAQSTVPGSHAADSQSAKPQEGGQPLATGGANTGGAHPAVLDSEHRPITAGGFVKNGPIIFQDIAQKAGLTVWTHVMGTPEKRFIIETNGSGVGLIDYDNDGWLDIYLVNGSTYDAMSGKTAPPHAALFRNNHDGTFTDVAAKAGVTNDRWGVGVAIADYDNDGWPDIYVTNFGKNRLYHNNHDGAALPTSQRKQASLSATGQPEPPGGTTTAMAGSISSSPATSITTSRISLRPAATMSPIAFVSFAARRSCAAREA